MKRIANYSANYTERDIQRYIQDGKLVDDLPEGLEIASMIGEPINTERDVPIEMERIAEVRYANAGERYYVVDDIEGEVGEVYDIAADGRYASRKVSPMGDVELSFQGIQTKQNYVLIDNMLGTYDQDCLGRKKKGLTKALNELELRMLINAVLNKEGPTNADNNFGSTIQTVTLDSGEDLYDVTVKAVQAIEDYGSKYVLLCGSTVYGKYDTYEKENAGTHNYPVGLIDYLRTTGIERIKVLGSVDYNDTSYRLMPANTFILVALKSDLSDLKPLVLVRRRIPPAVATLMGGTIDKTYRATLVTQSPIQVELGSGDTNINVLGYGITSYESISMALINPYAFCISEDLTGKL